MNYRLIPTENNHQLQPSAKLEVGDIMSEEKFICNVGLLTKKVEAFIVQFTQVERKCCHLTVMLCFKTWKGDIEALP